MPADGKDAEFQAAEAKQAAGEKLTPGDEVRIAVHETDAAAKEAVERGLKQAAGPAHEPSSDKPQI